MDTLHRGSWYRRLAADSRGARVDGDDRALVSSAWAVDVFTGIVSHHVRIVEYTSRDYGVRLALEGASDLVQGLNLGASVAVNGVCLTVVQVGESRICFDVIGETLERTTLGTASVGEQVNVERSARLSDEIGGHLLSGHVCTTAGVIAIDNAATKYIVSFHVDAAWMKYFFSKGFIAIDGVSLTLVDVDCNTSTFTVHLIPETLGRTTLGTKRTGDRANIEIDNRTQVIVDSIERILPDFLARYKTP